MSTDTEIDITIRLCSGVMQKLLPKKSDYGCNQLEKALGLYTTKTTTNMNLFTNKQQLKKYTNIYDIVDDYFVVRKELYHKRKEHQVKILEKDVMKLSNKAKFIQEQICEPPTLVLRKKKKHEVIEMLKEKEYDIIDDDKDYKYLRSMPIDSLEEENVAKLLKECGDKKLTLEALKNKKVDDIWLDELEELTVQYDNYRKARMRRAAGAADIKKVKKIKKIKKKKK